MAEIDPLQWPAPVRLMAECNFGSLKKEELEACYYYEYARQIKSMRGAVRKFTRLYGADFRKAARRKELAELLGKGSILKQRLVSLLAGSGFPKPWQLLSESGKEQLMETLPEAMAVLEVRKALCIIQGDPAQFGSFAEFRRQVVEQVGPGRVIAGAFAVNLAAGRGAIEKEFRRWLGRELRRGEKMWGEELRYFSFKAFGPTGWIGALNQLDKKTIARAASVSPRTLENLQAKRIIPFVRLSARCIRYHVPSVIRALRRFELKEVSR